MIPNVQPDVVAGDDQVHVAELVTVSTAVADRVLTQSGPAALPAVQATDLYAGLLADARKPATRRAREQDVGDFASFLASGMSRQAACTLFVAGGAGTANALVTDYVRHLLARALAPTTINRRVSTLKRLVRLANKFRVIDWSIDVESLRVEAYRDTAGPGQAGWLRILDAGETRAKKTAVGKRDLALIRLLHDHGLRREEVASLDLADLDVDVGRVNVLGKGRGEKSPIRLNKPTLLALSRYLDVRGIDPGPLFIRLDRARDRERLQRLDADGIHKLVATLGRKAGLSRPVRPHGLRHAAVTRVLELSNGNLDAAQRFARHKDPRTTQRYNDNRSDVAGQMAKLLGEDA